MQDITVAVHASLAFESPVFGVDEVCVAFLCSVSFA